MSMLGRFAATLKQMVTKTPAVQPVRFRYHADKPKYLRRFGYNDNLDRRGLLPRVATETQKLPMPTYR